MAPTVVAAQGESTQGRTYVVKAGDTLWDLARQFLNDPFLWPEIYRLNTDVVEDPHWIYPGETLTIPGGIVATEDGNAGGPTTFARMRQLGGDATADHGGVLRRTVRPTIRPGEYYAAPWVEQAGAERRSGRIVRAVDIPGIETLSDKSRYQLQEEMFVSLPAEQTAARGDRYLTVEIGPMLPGLGQVLIPTGVLRIERPGNGELSRARLVQQFDRVLATNSIVPFDSLLLTGSIRANPVDLGIHAKVVWLRNSPVLPALQQYMVLDATSRDGIQLGDQFTLIRPHEKARHGEVIPEIEIAIAEVVKVTQYGSTAILIDQTQPAIRTGTPARVSAKMP